MAEAKMALSSNAAGKMNVEQHDRKTIQTGLEFRRKFTDGKVAPFDAVEWERRTAQIGNEKGQVIFRQDNIEVPKSWSQTATNIVASTLHDRRRRPEDDRGVAAAARQRPTSKAYWIMMGLPMAQIALHFGADDVQGTVVREKIFQAAGARAAPSRRSPSSCGRSRRRAACRSSATRSTTS